MYTELVNESNVFSLPATLLFIIDTQICKFVHANLIAAQCRINVAFSQQFMSHFFSYVGRIKSHNRLYERLAPIMKRMSAQLLNNLNKNELIEI